MSRKEKKGTPSVHIGIVGAALAGNRGAEAMIVSCIGKMEEYFGPSCSFCLHSYFPAEDRRLLQHGRRKNILVVDGRPVWLVSVLFPIALLEGLLRRLGLRLPDRCLPKGVRTLRRCDVMLDVSGVSFCDGREKFLPFNFLNNWPVQWMGVPVVHLSQGKGPFEGALNKLLAKFVLGKCPAVFARGRASRAHLETLSLPGHVETAADIAFCYEPGFSLFQENEKYAESFVARLREHKTSGNPLFCLSVSAVVLRKCRKKGIDYIGMLGEVIGQLVSEGYHVVILPNATRDHCDSDHNNDLPLVKALLNDIPPTIQKSVLAIENSVTTETLYQVIAECDGILASRFHAMIGALRLGVPVAVCGWGHKYVEVLESVGMESWFLDSQDTTSDALHTLVKNFLRELPVSRQKIAASLEAEIDSSTRQFDWICAYLNERLDD